MKYITEEEFPELMKSCKWIEWVEPWELKDKSENYVISGYIRMSIKDAIKFQKDTAKTVRNFVYESDEDALLDLMLCNLASFIKDDIEYV